MSVHNPITQVLLPILVVVVMFALGTTLTRDDLDRVLRRPRAFFVGVVTHALLLPGLAFVLAFALELPRDPGHRPRAHRLVLRRPLRPASSPTSPGATPCSASA